MRKGYSMTIKIHHGLMSQRDSTDDKDAGWVAKPPPKQVGFNRYSREVAVENKGFAIYSHNVLKKP